MDAGENSGWWRWSHDGRRLAAEADGEYLHEEAVEAAGDAVSELAAWFSGVADVLPTIDAILPLLAGRHEDLPYWSDEAELVELAEAARARLGDIYERAWGRPPSEAELESLLSLVAAATPLARWLC